MTSIGSPVARMPRYAAAIASLAMLASAGCATPAQRVDREASSFGYARSLLEGRSFRHVVYANGRGATGRALHVYLDGDGSPYLDRWTVSPDPTPRHPLMLRLMALDPGPAVYVGRPCYLGLATEPPCTAIDWTLGRFGPGVVDSLEDVIRRLQETSGATHVDLFGHSGGGTLAVLLATRLTDVRRIVTLAGNLDPDAWADLHHYTRLSASLNPVRVGTLPGTIEQQHFAGGRDRVMPPGLVEAAAARLGAGGVVVLPDVSHASGWEKEWPAILAGHRVQSPAGSYWKE